MKSRVIDNINDISANDWDHSASDSNNPFCSHGFLSALEESGCVNAETGWHPQHIVLEDDKNIIGVMPLYLKNHSQGEYVFDHGWANAYQQAGGHYYPKLQCSIPFSPVTGHRLLAKSSQNKKLLLEASINHAKQLGISSLHFTFIENDDFDVMTSFGLLHRQDQQFHWINNGHRGFNDFLETLSSRKRKNINKERRTALENGIEVEWIKAGDIKDHHWDHYYDFYVNTANKKWGRPYLNREFFSLLSKYIPENLLLIMAKNGERYIAGALNLIGADTLYGRYWGATEYHKCLHFELCYYQAIEFAIKNKLSKVEAGAQGDHKIARGYIPMATNSMHWIENPSLEDAIKKFLVQERKAVKREIDYLSEFTPFKKDHLA
ncbi:MAG: GNAT family N-acetyltransferase [Emcibacteraceae bacterium]|nr:GNAT family N-acetyltransferase [Emcibacteraceae bacterium]MDG1858213.1 GNAT family N-acetyltransferase [Emcibacteraceae bacterium]